MLKSFEGGQAAGRPGPGDKRFACIVARDSTATALLHGCQIVTAGGEHLGRVKSILIDVRTRQLRYVLMGRNPGSATVAIPWHAMYFDSALARLVFYTFS
ncbi:MAG: PRC-barrel domain-containing protein [Lacisediminimonas sp.]|nr:PRC-barrel domain-containing protein [Lacisediminimonas sp.]